MKTDTTVFVLRKKEFCGNCYKLYFGQQYKKATKASVWKIQLKK
jgi:hypothetical protein